MYSYSYVLAAGYAAEGTVVEFTSSDATFDNNAKVFVPNADAQTIVVDLITDSVIYDEDNVTADELRIIKANAKNLVDEYVASVIAEASEADKAIIDANMTAVNTAVETAKTAIDNAADEAAVTAIISKAADGTYSGTQVTAIDTAIETAVNGVKDARADAESELRVLVSTLNSEAAAEVLLARLPELSEAMTAEKVEEVAEDIENAMKIAATPDATPSTPDDLITGDDKTDFEVGGTFEGMQNFVTTPTSVKKNADAPNTYDIDVTFSMTKTYNKDSAGPFNGFGGTGAEVLTQNGITGDAQNGLLFGFVAFQVEGNGTVVMIVGKSNADYNTPYTSRGTFVIDGVTYTANFNFSFQ